MKYKHVTENSVTVLQMVKLAGVGLQCEKPSCCVERAVRGHLQLLGRLLGMVACGPCQAA